MTRRSIIYFNIQKARKAWMKELASEFKIPDLPTGFTAQFHFGTPAPAFIPLHIDDPKGISGVHMELLHRSAIDEIPLIGFHIDRAPVARLTIAEALRYPQPHRDILKFDIEFPDSKTNNNE